MEYVTVDKGESKEGIAMKRVKVPKVDEEEKGGGPATAAVTPAKEGTVTKVKELPLSRTGTPIPSIPVFMDEDETFVDYRKPGFWAYSPSVFAVFFGLVLLVLFTAGGGLIGLIIGAIIFITMFWLVRSRLWARTGYWFTNHKIVVHDGSRIRLIPYDEIALSSLSFEGEDCMFNTVYHQEVVLKGIVDMDQVVAYISKRVKAARSMRKGEGGA